MDKIAVLIPCYNESKTIRKVIRDMRETLPEAMIYVYDNNSSDGTDLIAKEENAIVRYETQQGKGAVIRSMFQDIDADCYLMIDGDDTYPAENAREMVNHVLEKGYDMVIGDRLSSTYFTENKRKFHNFGNVLVRKMINFIFKSDIKDIMTGYRAFGYAFVKTFPVTSRGFEIETEVTIHALDKNMHIKTVEIPYRDRPDGSESKLNTFSDGAKVLRTIVTLFRNTRPMAFFGIVSIFLFVVAAALFIPVFIEFLETGIVPRFPTLIMSIFFGLAAIQSYFSGLILHVLVGQQKNEFEIHLNACKRDYHTYGEKM